MGDRGDHRPADQDEQDRGDRRSGPLRDPGSAQGELHRLVARVRPRRFGEDPERTRQDREHYGHSGPDRSRRGPVLSGDLLVLHAEDSGQEHVPGDRPQGQRHADLHEEPVAVDRPGQDQWLLCLPSARQQGDAGHPAGTRHVQEFGRGMGTACSIRTGDDRHGGRPGPAGAARSRLQTSPIGQTVSQQANCRSPSRSGRKASSATS